MIHPIYFSRKENAGLLDKICAEQKAQLRKFTLEHFSLNLFLRTELKSYMFNNPFIFDISCCEEKGDELVAALEAMTYQKDDIKIIVYAGGHYVGDELLDKLVHKGITNIAASYDDVDDKTNIAKMLEDLKECMSDSGLAPKKWRRYDRSYDALAEARAAALIAEKESAKPQYSRADMRIAVVGAQPRIGTTSFAVHLADYFCSRGAHPVIINDNPRGDMQLEMMHDIHDGIDNGDGSYRINNIDFYRYGAALPVSDGGVEIHDFGSMDGTVPDFRGYDKLYLVGGTSWSELPMMYQAQKELTATNYTAIINYSSHEQIRRNKDILSLNLNEVFCAPFEPELFSSTAYEELFDSEFDDYRDAEQDEASPEL